MMEHMKRLISLVLAVLISSTALGPVVAHASVRDRQPAPRASRVVLILAPYLAWEDVTPELTPALWASLESDAVGNLNSRSRAKDEGGGPSITEGALTISAGAWAIPDETAFPALDVDERFEYDVAGEAYRRLTGNSPGNASIVYLGLPRAIAANASNSFRVIPGTLASAIEAAGGATAALGNSDLGYSNMDSRIVRPAALVAMNEQGRVKFGTVSESILAEDPEAPYGVRTDLDQLRIRAAEVRGSLDKYSSSLLVVDPGDLFRANRYASVVSPEVASSQWNAALATLDATYAMAREEFPDATVIVTSLAAIERSTGREGFGPVIVSGMPSGLITSASTQREGLTVSMDLTATILQVLGAERPVQVIGTPMESSATYTDGLVGSITDNRENRIDLLDKMNSLAVSLQVTRVGVLNWFIGLTVAILAFGAFAVVRADRNWKPLTVLVVRRAIYLLILAVLAVLASSWLMFFFYRWPSSPGALVSQLLAVAAGIWFVTVLLARFFGLRVPLIFMAALTTAVIIVDQLLGAPASFASVFGYSPIMAFRFYGMGNEGAAVLFGAVVMGIVLTLDQWPDAPWSGALRKWGVPVIGLGVLVASAAPTLGANVGVVAWGTVGFVVLWALLNDQPLLSWKTVLLVVLVTVLTLAAFIALDRFSPGQETHLSRSIGSAEQGGLVELWDIVVRKAQTNLRVLTATSFAYIFIAVVAYLAFMRWRPTPDFAATLRANPYFSQGMVTILIAGVAAYFTEDSGIVLPALMVLYLGCTIVWLMLARLRGLHGAPEAELRNGANPLAAPRDVG